MSDLQTGLVALGAALIVGIFVFSRIQEFRYRRMAEQVLPESGTDALLEGETPTPRSEPVLEAAGMASSELSESAAADPKVEFQVTLRGAYPVSAADLWQGIISSAITTRNIRWAGFDAARERWFAIRGPSGQCFNAFAAMLQLSSRSGPANEPRLSLFVDEMRALAQRLGMDHEPGDLASALVAAEALDHFCAQVDVLIGINLMFSEGGEPDMQRMRGVAESEGLQLGEDGVFHARDEQQRDRFTLVHRDSIPFLDTDVDTSPVTGVTFLLDVPRVGDAPAALHDMYAMAARMAASLQGQVVDDNNAALGARQLAVIERQLTEILQQMEAQGIPAGSALALRLFSH